MGLDDNPTVIAVRQHLVEHLGPPLDVFEVHGSPDPGSPLSTFNVAFFAPDGADGPAIMATCGASLFRMKDGRRVEALVMLAPPPPPDRVDAVRRLLASFAVFPETSGDVVRLGDVVRAEAELAPFSRMDAIVFVPPFTFLPSFHRVGLPDGGSVELVWLLLIHASEAEYAIAHGAQALMSLFADQNIDLTHPHRGPANTSRAPEPSGSAGPGRAPQAGGAGPARPRGGPSRPSRRPRAGRAAPEVRFDLKKDGVVGEGRPKPGVSSRKRPDAKPDAPPPEPELTKEERIAALKKAALEARAYVKARAEGAAPETQAPAATAGHHSTSPADSPKAAATPGAARRPAPYRRGGASPPKTMAPATETTRAASRRRGAPRRPLHPSDSDKEG